MPANVAGQIGAARQWHRSHSAGTLPELARACKERGVELTLAILGPVFALQGVLLGGLLSARAQQRNQEQALSVSIREEWQNALVAFLAAVRKYRRFLMSSDVTMEVVPATPRSKGTVLVAGRLLYDAEVDEAYARLMIVGRSEEIVEEASELTRRLNDFVLRRDLARLGLMRRSNPDGSPLTADQVQVNARARDAVIESALGAARRHFDRVNVRFVRTSPDQVVGTGNFTTIRIGGLDPTQASLEYGFAVTDPANPHEPDLLTVIHSGEFEAPQV